MQSSTFTPFQTVQQGAIFKQFKAASLWKASHFELNIEDFRKGQSGLQIGLH